MDVTIPVRRHTPRIVAAAAAAVALALGPARAQDAAAEFDMRLKRGLDELASGDRVRARHHLLEALSLRPTGDQALRALLLADLPDEEARRLWLLYAANSGVPANGRYKLPAGWPKEAKADAAEAIDLARARASAATTTAAAAGRAKGARDAPLAIYLAGLQRVLTAPSPTLRAAAEKRIVKSRKATAAKPTKVTKALAAVMQRAYAAGDKADAMQAARLIRGLHQQANQEKNAAPQPSAETNAALAMIRRIRRDLAAEEQAEEESVGEGGRKVWTVQELEDIAPEDRPAWNEKHASWASPGIALSPTGKYRVETTCGLATLLAVTRDAELHHARLVRWYGVDPFEKRQGTIRIARSYADFESEGQPYWWAGGFQQGDITTLIARFATSEGLGGTLTHELTHRFDGTLLPRMSGWLVEGRAVYTQSCSIAAASETVDERRVRFGRLWETNNNGYGRKNNLVKLLRGTIDDYRHNYDAGYSLWLFLVRFRGFDPAQQGRPVFASRVPDYTASFHKKPRTAPVKRFEQHFCDGKDGRPDSLDALCVLLGRFLREGGRGFPDPEWRKPWRKAHRAAGKEARGLRRIDRIEDRATQPRSRTRHDPPDHGQYHAYEAGELLAKRGRKDAALEAFHWALLVDEPDADQFARAAEHDEKLGNAAGAWALRFLAHRVDPDRHAAPNGTPPGNLSGPAARVRGLIDALGSAATAHDEAGRPRLARALRADRDALAPWIGESPSAAATAVTTDPAPDTEPHAPDCRPYVAVARGDLVEERWAPLDSQVSGRWRSPSPALIELGRKQVAKAQSGQLRDAGIRRVFVRGDEFFGGSYTLRTRVRFVSAFADTQIVIGHAHRDRGVRIRMRGGDWGYAVGSRKEHRPLRAVRIELDDLRPYGTRASRLGRTIEFESPREAFELTVHVAGPYVRVLVNGRETLSHRRVVDTPVEGRVGFGLHSGIVAFEDARVRRHRPLGADHACPCDAHGAALRLDRTAHFPWATATGRRLVGVPPGPHGTVVLWFDESWPVDDREADFFQEAIEPFRFVIRRSGMPVDLHVAVPAEDENGAPFATADQFRLPPERFHEHRGHSGHPEAFAPQAAGPSGGFPVSGLPNHPTWVLLDDRGVIRAHGPRDSEGFVVNLSHLLSGW